LNFDFLAKTLVSWIYAADLSLTATIYSRKQSRVVAGSIHSKFYTSEISTSPFLSKHILETMGHKRKLTLIFTIYKIEISLQMRHKVFKSDRPIPDR
jgi:hypothetical protein